MKGKMSMIVLLKIVALILFLAVCITIANMGGARLDGEGPE